MDSSFNIERLIQGVLSWNLTVSFDGHDYRIRPLLVADVGYLTSAVAVANSDFAPLIEVLESFFVDPKPNVSEWPIEAISPVLESIQNYIQGNTRKSLPGDARDGHASDELDLAEFVAAVVEASQGSYSPSDVLAMRVDWAFFVVGGRAKLMTRIRAGAKEEKPPIYPGTDGATHFAMGGGPEVLRAILWRVKKT